MNALLVPTFDLPKHASVKTAAEGGQRAATPLIARSRFMGPWHAGIQIPWRQYGMSKTPKPQFTWASRMPPLFLVFASDTPILPYLDSHLVTETSFRDNGGNEFLLRVTSVAKRKCDL